ncbi:LTA synthase family protein [Collinsella sp. KGMB02528]|uniref:LTA synthase family protein n=1 Tax=Collinsella acetigenes TaxID=2713419 RepID=A0A7X9UAF3_9ACTN|nr:LTA synthase family protein [Collinsella acetigenes]NMF54832.1 LTA synthase family protein [Collinsella acetigenes]
MFAALVSLVGAAGTVLLVLKHLKACKSTGNTPSRTLFVRCGLILLIQLFFTVWSAIGLVDCADPMAVVVAIVAHALLCGCVYFNIHRDCVLERLRALLGAEGKFAHPLLGASIMLLLAGVFATLGLEFSSNHDLTWMYPLCLLLEWALIAFAMLGLFFLFQRRCGGAVVLAVALYVLGLAEYFVILFKSMPISPDDLTALSTAAAVAGTGFTYTITSFCMLSLAFTVIAIQICTLAAQVAPKRQKGSWRGLVLNLLIAIVCLGGIAAHTTLLDYYHTLYIQVYPWRPLESYYRQGFLPSFISGAQTIKPSKPEDYTVSGAKKLISEYAKEYDGNNQTGGSSSTRLEATKQFDEEKPTVIAVMNETFSDLSIYQNMHADYQGPTYFKSIDNCLSRGRLYVSAYGGGTANTEFEFLTGNSMAYLGSGVYPYTTYDLTDTENLAAQFKSLGYYTTAMHPNHGTNWNRENVYKDFGFDQFLTINDFQNAETLRGMVTDKATYDKILELLDTNSNPQFIFDVTMQNHSGYDTGLIPYDKQMNLNIDGEYNSNVNEYVSLIQQSDEALKYFLNKLSKLDRKVVVVFWGDHQPFFPDTYNDRWFTNEDDATHQERLWQTSYIIWANYDVAGNSQTSQEEDLSSNYLSSELMKLIGAPLTDYQKAHLTLRQSLPALNSVGYEDSQDRWLLSSSKSDEAYNDTIAAACEKARSDYHAMQYYMMFGDGKDIYTKHYQDAANETDPNLAPGTTKIK